MTEQRCVRCGERAQGFAVIGDDRLCHGDLDSPTCYETAARCYDSVSWDQLKKHWAQVQVETRIEVERLRRQHPDRALFGPPSAHLLLAIGAEHHQ